MKYLKHCVLLLILSIFAVGTFVIAEEKITDRNQLKSAKAYLRSKIIYWQKFYNCTPYSTSIGNQWFEIVGKEKGKCHAKIQGIDCYYPMEVAKKYSYNAENMIRKAIDELDSKGTVNQSTIEKESGYIQQINYEYCQIQKF